MTKMEEMRTLMGMTGAEVARRIGVSKQAYYNYERGLRQAGYENLLKIAEVLGCSVDALLDREPENKKIAPADTSRSAIIEKISRLSDDQLRRLAEEIDLDRLLSE